MNLNYDNVKSLAELEKLLKKRVPKRSIYEMNFDRLSQLFGVEVFENPKMVSTQSIMIENEPFMKLSLNFLYEDGEKGNVFYLAHTNIQNGDVMDDPGMELRVFVNRDDLKESTVEALFFKNHYANVAEFVYLDDGRYYAKRKKSQNSFLRTWLMNLKQQGFGEALKDFREANQVEEV